MNSNRSSQFFDYIARIYGDKGFETLLNVTSKVQRYKPLLDDSADISGESYWNEILVVIENRFEGYRFMQLLPRKIDFEYLENKSEVFIRSMDKLLISGAFLALRHRFSLDLSKKDKQNISPKIKTLCSTIRHLEHLFENPGTENMQISLRLQKEKGMQGSKV